MDIEQVIEKIINIPDCFYKLGNVSIYSLLESTGYFQIYESIIEEDIIKGLDQHEEAIGIWLDWSENKRADSGWYFSCVNKDDYAVGLFSIDKTTKPKYYTNKKVACASFIKLEIENIRINRNS